MDASLSCGSIEVVVKRVETFGDGVWAQKKFCSVQNFDIPSHHFGKLYHLLQLWLRTNHAEPWSQTLILDRPFYSERMRDEREKSLWRRNHHVQMVNLLCFHGVQASTHNHS